MHRSSGRAFLAPPLAGSSYPTYILAQSGTAVSGAADTNENTLATITVPANAMGPNGQLRIWTDWTWSNTADDKTARIRFSGASGTIFLTVLGTTSVGLAAITLISNQNNAAVQRGGITGSGPFAVRTAAAVTAAVDTTAATTIVITGQKETGTDTLTLDRYVVEVLYGA